MTPALVFRIGNGVALLFWACLIFAPNWKLTRQLVHTGLASLTLCGLYLALLLIAPPAGEGGGFSSLEGVHILFSSDWILCAGWVHYLAFDLFIGAWIARDARAHGLAHWFLIPILLATFWLGPVGLLAYFTLFRFRKTGLPELAALR